MTDVKYIEAGSLYDGTDPTYGETQYSLVFECSRCAALVGQWSRDDHTRWHVNLLAAIQFSPAPAG